MKNWENSNLHWYKTSIHIKTHYDFEELLRWINTNLDGHRKHTVWRLIDGGYFEIKFRYKRHFEWFILRWG